MNGTVIREIRVDKGISLNKLSKLSGVSKSYISFIERGKQTNPSISVIERIASALDIDVDVLLSKEKNKENDTLNEEIVALAKRMSTSDLSNQNIKMLQELLDLLKKD
ncbi:helix-turn-helix domain-containing protein [Bacillus sp. PS06]|uniref:helix-turn-helix domain-containing protein n=1 Tax=Bacillus sp. PS06 TaxID=2764176 RepID=UPI001781724B|nr:helix-turn-helix transcriptional regulator [Bacillus sp. PS06]MBD8071322.1 helix-turn-helix transcriptional regulator [Bacillus sp. PS06]